MCGCGLNLAHTSWTEHAERAKGPNSSGAQGGLQPTGAPRGAGGPLSSHTSVDSTAPAKGGHRRDDCHPWSCRTAVLWEVQHERSSAEPAPSSGDFAVGVDWLSPNECRFGRRLASSLTQTFHASAGGCFRSVAPQSRRRIELLFMFWCQTLAKPRTKRVRSLSPLPILDKSPIDIKSNRRIQTAVCSEP